MANWVLSRAVSLDRKLGIKISAELWIPSGEMLKSFTIQTGDPKVDESRTASP